MNNLNPYASLYAYYYIISAIVFMIMYSAVNYSLGMSLFILFLITLIPNICLTCQLLYKFPLAENFTGYMVCSIAIAIALTIAIGSL